MSRHHPADELLLEHAAGRLAAGMALVVDVHADGCAACRERLRLMHALGGALVDEGEGTALAPDAWARTLERIDAPAPIAAAPSRAPGRGLSPDRGLPPPPEGLSWPRRLARVRGSRWLWMGPGMRYARLDFPADPQGKLFLLRIGPGRSLPRHTHDGIELTQVLTGTFDDGRDTFGPGDFDATDDAVLHQPVVRDGGVCVCLAYVGRRLRFEGRVASLVAGWVGM